MAYDDIFRVTVGEQSIEVQRGELREGRMALVARGTVNFHSLVVKGLDMFAFPFTTSRYRSFDQHIQSFTGEIDTISDTLMGAGGGPPDIAALYNSTRNAIAAAMQPDSTDQSREAVFGEWVVATSLPLKTDLTELQISRYTVGTQTAFLVLESPEPLDFSEEITPRLQKKKKIVGGFDFSDLIADLLNSGKVQPVKGFGLEDLALKNAKERAAFTKEILFRENAIDRLNDTVVLPATGEGGVLSKVRGLESTGDGLAVDLGGMEAGNLVFFELVEEGDGMLDLRFYQVGGKGGGGKAGSGGFGGASGGSMRKAEPISLGLKPSLRAQLENAVAGSKAGTLGVIDLSGGVIEFMPPQFQYGDVDVVVIQDGSRTRALVIPVGGNNHEMLTSGRYKLEFTLFRKRWETNAAPDDLNCYSQASTLTLDIG
jgi:hypothetical protein